MIGLIGLDHHAADVDLRGRVSFADERLRAALRELAALPALREVVVLSTCNRTEVYFAAEDGIAAGDAVRRYLAGAFVRGAAAVRVDGADAGVQTQAPVALPVALPVELARALYAREDEEAARHLCQVAAGLRSMVLGEAEILGQVKDALTAAEMAQTLGDELRALFTTAIKVGKRVRAETEIGRADVSVAAVAVRTADEALAGLRGKAALLIGAGRTIQLCAHLLAQAGVARLALANRTLSAAETLAREVDGEALPLAGIAGALPQVDLVISATASPQVVLDEATVAGGLVGRTRRLVIFDLAVPPDVAERVRGLPGVTLYTLDALRADDLALVEAAANREATLAEAEQIIAAGLRALAHARTVRLAAPGIAALRTHVDRSQRAELEQALAQLGHLSPEEKAIIERFGRRLVDKMFHHLVSRIRALAEYDEVPPELTMRVLARLFADPDGGDGV
ncbi:MAG: Glutamyl-tRNA reductase [Ktedonobacterales bacterium]|jgi:glutamyl-tRNA reductase|nr:MAG: Glutamyl-tRNA reductase [Ktedonobacterales bacterium]